VAAVRKYLLVPLFVLAACGPTTPGSSDQPTGTSSDGSVPVSEAPSPTAAPVTQSPDTSADIADGATSPRLFAAVGDSYASGLGGGDHYDCGRSPAGWVGQLAEMYSADAVVLACPGDVLADALDQVDRLPEEVTDVAISVLGNDLGFFQVVAACASAQCAPAVESSLAALPGLRQPLDLLLMRSADAGRTVILSGYPAIFGPGCTAPISGESAALIDQAVVEVNAFLSDAASRAASAGFPVSFVPAADFTGHGVCDPDPWVFGFDSELMLHPTFDGHRAMALAAFEVIGAAS
jgi:lysophospholipase L1-like esterase